MDKIIKMNGSDLIHLKDQLKEAQEKHDQVKELLYDLYKGAGVIKPVNLKLHDIAFKADTEDFERYFHVFCESAYYDFKVLLKENNLYTRHVGRTSSFYIESRDLTLNMDPYFYEWGLMDLEDFSYNLARGVDIPACIVEYETLKEAISAGVRYDPLEDVLNDIIGDLDYYIESVNRDLSDQLKALKTAYTYIEDFKRDQESIWGGYIEEVKEYA